MNDTNINLFLFIDIISNVPCRSHFYLAVLRKLVQIYPKRIGLCHVDVPVRETCMKTRMTSFTLTTVYHLKHCPNYSQWIELDYNNH